MLTVKGLAVVLLRRVEREWDGMNSDQQAECAELVARLNQAMRRDDVARGNIIRPVRVPLVGRISA